MHYKEEKLLSIASSHHGILFSKMADEHGVERRFIQQLVQKGQLIKHSRGLYILPKANLDLFYINSFYYSKGVYDIDSAFYLHHFINDFPKQFTLTLPKGTHTTRIIKKSIAAKTMDPFYYSKGIVTVKTDYGHKVKAYSLEYAILHLLLVRHCYSQDQVDAFIFNYLTQYGRQALIAAANSCRLQHRLEKVLLRLGLK